MAILTKTRDSVCAGDDGDAPHEVSVKLDAELVDIPAFVRKESEGYLPSVDGVGHSWTAWLNGENVATITADDIIPLRDILKTRDQNDLYFEYHAASY